MFRYYFDEDDDDFEYGLHHPMDGIARLLLMQRLMGMQLEREHGSQKSTFIKDWSTRRSSVDAAVALKTAQSAVSVKVAPLFNILYEDFADLVIISKGCGRLYVHQLVVASWSNVLKQGILAERRKWDLTKVILPPSERFYLEMELNDDEDTLVATESFFRFMYTESVELSFETVWAHIRLAIFYKVNELLVVCMQFMQRQLSTISIRPFLVKFMDRARQRGLTSTVIEITMLRIQSELFLEEAEVVSSFDVDFLCDVLRSSDIVANSEYDIFQKLKPKLADLKKAGKIRQVQRLLGLLRLTQMKASELRELSSGEYMEEMREAFPCKLESALWARALLNEQYSDAVPLSVEMPRLYLEVPVPHPIVNDTERYEEYEGWCSRAVEDFQFEQQKFEAMTFKVKGGEQVACHDVVEKSGVLSSRSVRIYRVEKGHHSVKQVPEFCRLEIPSGKFDFVTVNYKLPRIRGATFQLVMVFCIENKAGTKIRVFTQTDDTTETGVQCVVFPLPLLEDCDVSLTDVVCYTYHREHCKVSRMNWNEVLRLHFMSILAGQMSASESTLESKK